MTSQRTPTIHYLRENKGERTPHRLLVVDTEASSQTDDRRELQTLRCWSARLILRHDRGGAKAAGGDFAGHTVAELLDCVLAANTGEDTLWLFTHNLSYDLGLTRLPLHLIHAGYALGRHNLASEAPWAYLKRKSRGLRLADSWSWLPTSVEKLGEALGLAKPALPADGDDDATWAARCAADVHITATALCRLMDEWDARALGWWSLTGPASGWNSYLHMTRARVDGPRHALAHAQPGRSAAVRHAAVVVDPDPTARAFERQALYSGRRDLWTVGKLPPGPWAELDLKTAHLAVCAAFPLPYRRWRAFDSLALDDWRLGSSVASVIAECIVSTASPRYPLRVRGGILHPVGTFQTTLAGPELVDARNRGDLLAIGRGYGYHLGPHMATWAQWALAQLGAGAGAVDPLFALMVKGWSRTVPGRWGMTVSRQIAAGASHQPEWELEPALVGTPPRRGFILHLGGEWSEYVRDQEADDAFPAVLAFVQSWTRLLLNRALDALGEGSVVSCNTEGVWANMARVEALGAEFGFPNGWSAVDSSASAAGAVALSTATYPLTMRIKRVARALRVLSPQHLEVDGERQFAGIPRAAVLAPDGRYEFWTWPKLNGQMERGDPRGYIRELRRVDLSGLPVSRWAHVDGCCDPVRAAWTPAEGTTLLPPPADGCRRHQRPLRAVQHPALRRLLP